MSVRFITLATGSKGNCSYVGTPHAQLLVDCGIGIRRLAQLLAMHGIDYHQLDAVLITHLHTDHIGGLAALLRRVPLRVYVHARAAAELSAILRGELVSDDWRRFMQQAGPLFEVAQVARADIATFNGDGGFHHRDVDVLPLPVSHDCDPTVAYKLFAGGRRIGVVTDLGTYDETLHAAFGDCDLLLLEANHCPRLLATGPYPEFLKRRIRGDKGHLSNEQALSFAANLAQRPRHLILGHLSDNNNHPDAVSTAFEPLFASRHASGESCSVLTQLTCGPLLEL